MKKKWLLKRNVLKTNAEKRTKTKKKLWVKGEINLKF